jgi:hypothetical protein
MCAGGVAVSRGARDEGLGIRGEGLGTRDYGLGTEDPFALSVAAELQSRMGLRRLLLRLGG